MRLKKLTNEEVNDIIEREGLGYAVTTYLSADRIKDPELKMWWKKAEQALDKIEQMLSDYRE